MELTKDEAYAVANFIDFNLIENIRNKDCDNIEWLINMIHAYEKLRDFSGYEGLTE